MGTFQVIQGFGKYLPKYGIELHVFSPYTDNYVDDGIVFHKFPSLSSSNLMYKVIRFIYKHPILAKRSLLTNRFLTRSINQLTSSIIPVLKEVGIDLIQGEQEIPSAVANNIKKIMGIPSIAHFHNYWPDECIAKGLITNKDSNYGVLKDLVKHLITDSDLVVTVTEELKNHLIEQYNSTDEKIKYVPLGITPPQKLQDIDYNTIRIVYSGSLAKHENVELFLQSIPLIKSEIPLEFYITGKGENKHQLQAYAEQNRIPVKFLWFSEPLEYRNFLQTCHIGIIPWSHTPTRRFGFPMKMLDYLAQGLAIVSTNPGGWTSIVRNHDLGILTEDNPSSLAQGITASIIDLGKLEKQRNRLHQFVKTNFQWEKGAKDFASYYYELVKK